MRKRKGQSDPHSRTIITNSGAEQKMLELEEKLEVLQHEHKTLQEAYDQTKREKEELRVEVERLREEILSLRSSMQPSHGFTSNPGWSPSTSGAFGADSSRSYPSGSSSGGRRMRR